MFELVNKKNKAVGHIIAEVSLKIGRECEIYKKKERDLQAEIEGNKGVEIEI